MLVGVWFDWPSGPLFGAIAHGIREELTHWGYHAVFENGGLQVGGETVGVNALLHKALDGFIVAPSTNPRDDHSTLFQLIARKVPLVLVDHQLAGHEADLVTTAGEPGAEEVVDHLVELGHRRIGQQAARLLMQRIRSPRDRVVSLLLEGRLIQRASTAPPRDKA